MALPDPGARPNADDGPMLDVLHGFHGATIDAPTKRASGVRTRARSS
jgi:hypothetical protein